MGRKAAVSSEEILKRRAEPVQDRSSRTLDRILEAAAELLAEVGFERLSTNMICKRAGVTPPALYRYFPNKYSVLRELGERLMHAQNSVFNDWLMQGADPADPEGSIVHLMTNTAAVTREQTAGAWIMRTLHAHPLLVEVRLASHDAVARALTAWAVENGGTLERSEIHRLMRLTVEAGYAIIEMLFDETGLDEEAVISEAAAMLAGNFRRVLSGE